MYTETENIQDNSEYQEFRKSYMQDVEHVNKQILVKHGDIVKTTDFVNMLIQYYKKTRGVGHTELLLRGIEHVDRPIFVMFNELREAHRASTFHNVRFDNVTPVTPATFDKTMGYNKPLIIDHYVLTGILQDMLLIVEQKDITIHEHSRHIKHQYNELNDMTRKYHDEVMSFSMYRIDIKRTFDKLTLWQRILLAINPEKYKIKYGIFEVKERVSDNIESY